MTKKDPISKIILAAKAMAALGYEEEGLFLAKELENGLRARGVRFAQAPTPSHYDSMGRDSQQQTGGYFDWFTNGWNAMGNAWGRSHSDWASMLSNYSNRLWQLSEDIHADTAVPQEVRATLVGTIQPALRALEEVRHNVGQKYGTQSGGSAAPQGGGPGAAFDPTTMGDKYLKKTSARHFGRTAQVAMTPNQWGGVQDERVKSTEQNSNYTRTRGALLKDLVDIFNDGLGIFEGELEKSFSAQYEAIFGALKQAIDFIKGGDVMQPNAAGGMADQARYQIAEMAQATAMKGADYAQKSQGKMGFEEAWTENTQLLTQRVQQLVAQPESTPNDKLMAQQILSEWPSWKTWAAGKFAEAQKAAPPASPNVPPSPLANAPAPGAATLPGTDSNAQPPLGPGGAQYGPFKPPTDDTSSTPPPTDEYQDRYVGPTVSSSGGR